MLTDIRFELQYALEREDVRNNLALSRMLGPVTSVEEASVDGHECVVEVALQGSVPMSIDDLEGVWVGD